MTGKEQAELLINEISKLRDEIFQIKKEYTSWFIHNTIKNIFENSLKYYKMGKYTGSWLGYNMYGWEANGEPVILINQIIEKLIYKYHTGTYHLKDGMILFCRQNKTCKYNLNDWNSQAMFFIDHDDFYLYIKLKIKIKNRWYRYILTENNIEYKQIKPPKFRY